MTNQKNHRNHFLCACDDIPEMSTKTFELMASGKQLELFLIHHNDSFHAYLNRCPHTGISLNWLPNQFYDYDQQFIQCSNHGALFRINDGYCLSGPCAGKSLISLNLIIAHNQIFLDLDDSITL